MKELHGAMLWVWFECPQKIHYDWRLGPQGGSVGKCFGTLRRWGRREAVSQKIVVIRSLTCSTKNKPAPSILSASWVAMRSFLCVHFTVCFHRGLLHRAYRYPWHLDLESPKLGPQKSFLFDDISHGWHPRIVTYGSHWVILGIHVLR